MAPGSMCAADSGRGKGERRNPLFTAIHGSGKKVLPSSVGSKVSRGNSENSDSHIGQWEDISALRTLSGDLFGGAGH